MTQFHECLNPIYLKDLRINVPCGKCEYCRQVWISDWGKRLAIQKDLSKFTIIATLTYTSENLPKKNGVPMLSKDDIQKFFKRVRKYLSCYYKDVSIQYFIAGEYGSSYFRPHYHLILFVNTDNNTYTQYDFQTIMLDKWRKGYIKFSKANNLSIMYMSKYMGKTTGISEYAESNEIPLPFILMSRRPAIASAYLDYNNAFEWHLKNLENDKIIMVGLGKMRLPRYLRRKIWANYPKHLKHLYYQQKFDKKQNDYENKLEKRAVRLGLGYLGGSINYQFMPDVEQIRRQQQLTTKGKQINDIEYLQLIKQ